MLWFWCEATPPRTHSNALPDDGGMAAIMMAVFDDDDAGI